MASHHSGRFCRPLPLCFGLTSLAAAIAFFTLRQEAGQDSTRLEPTTGEPAKSLQATARSIPTIPTWATPFGSEFWRPATSRTAGKPASSLSTPPAPVPSIANAIDRATHAFRSSGEGTSQLAEAETATYHAILAPTGLRIETGASPNPNPPAASTSATSNPVVPGFSIQTAALRRGSHLIPRPALPETHWYVAGNSAQALVDASSGLVEHFEATPNGVEVTWILPHPLPPGPDLVIETSIVNAETATRTATGLHLAANDGQRLKVGPALAIDRLGQQWPVAMEFADGKLEAHVPAAVLAAATYPLAIDPLLSPEFDIDQPVPGPTPCTRAAPSIAVANDGYLVVWTHGKSDTTDPAVYAARLDLAGNLLDPYGIPVSYAAAEQTVCAVAANPTGYLAVWTAPHGTSTTLWDILGTRIQPDGTILDVPPLNIALATTGSSTATPAVAANGTDFLVIWRDERSTGIYGTPVSATGVVARTNGYPICTAVNDQFTPAIAALGTNYLVAWQDYRKATSSQYHSDIYAARVSPSGTVLDTAGIAVCTRTNSQFHPTVAANGTHWLVVWEDYHIAGNDIAGARLDPNGLLLDPTPITIAHADNAQSRPAVTATGNDFFVVWEDYHLSPTNSFASTTRGTRIRDDGTVLDPDGIALSPATFAQFNPAVAGRTNAAVAVWQDSRNNPDSTLADIYGTQVDCGEPPTPNPDYQLSGTANAETTPAIAASSNLCLVVWSDTRNARTSGRDILALRLDPTGLPLDPTPIPVCTAPNLQADPAVACDGTNFLVVWTDYRNTPAYWMQADIFAAFVSPNGLTTPADGFPVCRATNDQTLPAVAFLQTNYWVAWQDCRNSLPTTQRFDIFGARVAARSAFDPGPLAIDPVGIPICTNVTAQYTPALAANGPTALVVWSDYRHSSTSSRIYGSRVTDEGSVLDPAGLRLCTFNSNQSAPTLAANGLDYLVAWADARNGTAYTPDIYAAHVAPDGLPQPPAGFPLRIAQGPQNNPTVAFDGSDFLVVWQESRTTSPGSYDLAAIRLASTDTYSVTPAFTIDTNPLSQTLPAAVALTSHQFLVVSQGTRYAAPRITAVRVDLTPLPQLSATLQFADGQFQLRLLGASGERYRLQASEDLLSWTTLDEWTQTAPSVTLTDPATTNLNRRFYRAVLLP